MALSHKMENALKVLEQSQTSEGRAVAECLRGIAENAHDDEDIDMSSDEFLVGCAAEIRDWADAVVKGLRTEKPEYQVRVEDGDEGTMGKTVDCFQSLELARKEYRNQIEMNRVRGVDFPVHIELCEVLDCICIDPPGDRRDDSEVSSII